MERAGTTERKVRLGKWVAGQRLPENPQGKAGEWVYEARRKLGRIFPGWRFVPAGYIPPVPEEFRPEEKKVFTKVEEGVKPPEWSDL